MSENKTQEMLDKTFPDGALLTVARSDEASAYADDSPQYRIEMIRVIEEDETSFSVSFKLLGVYRDLVYEVLSFDKRNYGLFAETVEGPGLLISNRISEEQKQAVQENRS